MKLKKHLRPFLRYLAVFSVPVICMATLLLYNNVASGYKTTQQEALSQMAEASAQLDWLSARMEATALHMAGSERLTGLSASGFDASSYTATRTFGLLRSYERNLPQPVGMLFYLRGGKNIYANQVFELCRLYSERGLRAGAGAGRPVPEPEQRGGQAGGGHRQCAARHPVLCGGVLPRARNCREPQLHSLFLVPRTYAEGVLEQYFPGLEACAFVMDAAGNVLYNGAGKCTAPSRWSSCCAKNPQPGVMSLTAGGEKYILLRGRSGNTGLEYLVLVPRGLFYRRSQNDLGALALLVAVLLVFSTLMALSLANSAYRTLRKAQQQREEIAVELDSRNSLIREMVLYRLLQGTIANDDDATLEYNLTCAGLRFEHNEFSGGAVPFVRPESERGRVLHAWPPGWGAARCPGSVYPVLLPANNGLAAIWNCPAAAGAQERLAGAVAGVIGELGLEQFRWGAGGLTAALTK